MNKILLISLTDSYNFTLAIGVAAELKRKYPDCTISLLTSSENKETSATTPFIKNFHFINLERIKFINNNRLYSNAFGLNHFFECVAEIRKNNWDCSITISNDEVSKHIASSMNSRVTWGLKYNEDKTLRLSGAWSLLRTDTLSALQKSYFHDYDILLRTCHLSRTEDERLLITIPELNKRAFENIEKLKDLENIKGESVVAGIKISKDESDGYFENYISIIEAITSTSNIIPLLLITPTDDERLMANKVNKHFSNGLTVAQADLSALPSILLNIDLLITNESLFKRIANLTRTPVIETSKDIPYSNHSTQSGDIVIVHGDEEISGAHVVNCINHIIANSEMDVHVPHTTFKVNTDKAGLKLEYLAGNLNKNQHIQYLTTRIFIYSLTSKTDYPSEFKEIATYANSLEFGNWIKSERSQLLRSSKLLLAILREFNECRKNYTISKNFMNSLSQILNHTPENYISDIVIGIFNYNIDKIISISDRSMAYVLIEKLLLELKTNIQKMAAFLNIINGHSHTNISASTISERGKTYVEAASSN